jgi:hypothetical protein
LNTCVSRGLRAKLRDHRRNRLATPMLEARISQTGPRFDEAALECAVCDCLHQKPSQLFPAPLISSHLSYQGMHEHECHYAAESKQRDGSHRYAIRQLPVRGNRNVNTENWAGNLYHALRCLVRKTARRDCRSSLSWVSTLNPEFKLVERGFA